MQNFFQTKAVENTPAQPQLTSKASKQVQKSLNEILDLSPEIAEFVLTSENDNWSYIRSIDFEGRLIAKYAIKSEGNFTMDTQYRFSQSQRDPNEYLGYPVFTYEVKGVSLGRRERPAPISTPAPVAPVAPAIDPDLIAQAIALIQAQQQQQPTAPAPKTTGRKSAPKVDEADMPF